jgi:glycosyltransferase involved in cell wall biosynthesis
MDVSYGRSLLPQISIIITAYNVQDYIATAILSALNQQDAVVEVIVVVDGGSDNTANIVNEFTNSHPQLIVLVKTNGGVSSARNAGLQLATAEHVMFLDGDDALLPNACQQFLHTALASNADIVVSDYLTVKEGSSTHKLKQVTNFSPMPGPEFALAILAPKSTVSVWNKCYKRQLFSGVQFPENVSMGEDLIALFDVSLKATLVVPLAEPTLIYLIRNSSLVNSSSQHLFSITTVMQMLKTRLEASQLDRDLALDIYAATAFYHVLYSRVLRDERFGIVHQKMYQWYVTEVSVYSGRTKAFIQTLPTKERFLIACYQRSYLIAKMLVRTNTFFRGIFGSKK